MSAPVGPAILFHPSWPEPARELLARAIDRHGGWALWQRLDSVTLRRRSLGGLLPWIKGQGRTFQMPAAMTTFPKVGRTDWYDAAGACIGVFVRGDVRLLDPVSGQVVSDSPDHRRTFRGWRKLRRWTTLDALYFFGYALASYAAVPFILPDLRFCGLASGSWRGEPCRGVEVEFPAGAQVHSRRQRYLFDRTGLLRRNDYVADVVGAWATGAHGWDDYTTSQGLPVPTRRTVLWRLGMFTPPLPPVLDATFDGVAVGLSGGAGGVPPA